MSRFLPIGLLALVLSPGCAAHKIATLEEGIAARDAAIQRLTAENQGYVVEIGTLKEEVARLGKKNEELVGMYQALLTDFGPRLESGQATLIVFPDRTTLVVGDPIPFASGSARLTPAADASLDELAAFLKEHPGRRFQVEGHTDAEPIHNGQFASNWELGAARAISVVDALVDRGVSDLQLSAATFGATEPVATNTHPDGMALNRRIAVSVEIAVSESGAQQALLDAAKKAGGAQYAQTRPIDEHLVAGVE